MKRTHLVKQSRHIVYSLLVASGLLTLCVILRPEGLAANDGLSYYGSVWVTLVPFAAAMIIYEYCLWKTSQAIGHNRKYRFLAVALKVMSVLAVGVLITPIHFMEDFHSVIGLVLFIVQLIVSFKLLAWGFHWFDAGLVAIEVLGFATGFYFAFFEHGLLLQAQVAFQVAFIALLVRSLTLLHIRFRQIDKKPNIKKS